MPEGADLEHSTDPDLCLFGDVDPSGFDEFDFEREPKDADNGGGFESDFFGDEHSVATVTDDELFGDDGDHLGPLPSHGEVEDIPDIPLPEGDVPPPRHLLVRGVVGQEIGGDHTRASRLARWGTLVISDLTKHITE